MALGSELGPGLGEDGAQDLLDLVEDRLVGDQRRGELDDRVATVVGAAVETVVVQRLGEEAVQDALGLLVVEGLLGGLVLDELDAVEEAVAADVADDRQVVQLLEGAQEVALVVEDVLVEALALEDVEVGDADGRGDRVAAEGVAVQEGVVALVERLGQPVGDDAGTDRE